MPRWRARRPAELDAAAQLDPAARVDVDARLDVAVRVAEVRLRSEATELVLRDRHDPQWTDDVRGWLAPLMRVAERG